MNLPNDHIVPEFNRKAADELPETDFCAFLTGKFGRETAVKIVESFQKLNLPAPQNKEEFLVGTEGCLVLLNRYGLVMRIEIADLEESDWPAERINDSGWIVQPVASFDAGKATIEICPGLDFERDKQQRWFLQEQLQNESINFWDSEGVDNIGRLPVKTPRFPEGVPVVIDRLAVVRLSRSIEPVREELKVHAREAAEAQKNLYAPLRRAFAAAWEGTGKMESFWSLCQFYVGENKLVAGWNEAKDGDSHKSLAAAKAAKIYAARLQPAAAGSPSMTFAQWLKTLPGR